MIVITLTKVPPSLRGDLTKWCQQIQAGVFVGNVSARIRDLLWERILENLGDGYASLVFSAQNEVGYQFRTTDTNKKVVDFDGIPLLLSLDEADKNTTIHGFSNAAKFRKAHKYSHSKTSTPTEKKQKQVPPYVVLDLETTGLNSEKDDILTISVVRQNLDGTSDKWFGINRDVENIPDDIVQLTGVTTDKLEAGQPLKQVLEDLREFVGEYQILGYNIDFDHRFLDSAMRTLDLPVMTNVFRDIAPFVKRDKLFLPNYKLNTVLKSYGIVNSQPHDSTADVLATSELVTKLIKNGIFSF